MERTQAVRPLRDVRADAERQAILQAIEVHRGDGNLIAVARSLRICRKSLYLKLRRYGLFEYIRPRRAGRAGRARSPGTPIPV